MSPADTLIAIGFLLCLAVAACDARRHRRHRRGRVAGLKEKTR